MKQTLLTLLIPLLAFSAFTLPIAAQPGDEIDFVGPEIDGPGGHHGGRHGLGIPPRRFLVNVLGLTEEQLEEVAILAETIKETVGPLREELRAHRADLQAEMSLPDPDPTTVGELVIWIRDLSQEIKSVVESFKPDFVDILTPAQIEIWEEVKDRLSDRPRPRRRGHRGDRPRPDAPEF